MKRALIAIATVGILAPASWVVEANAQYGAPAPSPAPGDAAAPAYAPAPAYRNGPSRRYARRTYRRSYDWHIGSSLLESATQTLPRSHGSPKLVATGAFIRRHLRHIELGIHEQGEFKRPACAGAGATRISSTSCSCFPFSL